MANYIGQLEPFVAGSNFDAYEDRVREFLKANNVEEDRKTSVFISIMGQETYDILMSLTVPDKPSGKSFEELLKTLGGHFAPKTNKRAERYKFNKAVQQSGESISDFVVRLKTLAQTCRFGEFKKTVKVAAKSKDGKSDTEVDVVTNYKMLILDEALTDRFIVGLNNVKIQQRLLGEDNLGFDECCLLAINMELSQKESQAIQPNRAFVNKVAKSNQDRGKFSQGQRSRSRSRGPEVKSRSVSKDCRRYGRMHDPSTCPAVSWKCYVCNKIGHTSTKCFKRDSSKKDYQSRGSSHIKTFMVDTEQDDELHDDLAGINVVRSKFRSERVTDREPVDRILNVEGRQLNMEVDSGAAAAVMCQQEYEERFSHVKLSPVSDNYKVLTGESIKALGQIEVRVWFDGVLRLLSMIVVATDGYAKALWVDRGWMFCNQVGGIY